MFTQEKHSFSLPFMGKKVLFILIIFCAFFNSLSAQNNSGKDKLRVSLNVNVGAVVSLSKHNNSIFYVPIELRAYSGVLANLEYKKITIETGIQRFIYPVSMGVKDTAVMTGHEGAFNSEFTAYRRIPLSIGYKINLKNRHFILEPYLSGGVLISASSYSYLSSEGDGSLFTAQGDTITYIFNYGLHRTKKSAFQGGIGVKLKYNYRRLVVSVNAEYFQTFDDWGTLYGLYERNSLCNGYLYEKQSFTSVDRNIIAGISVGLYLFK